MPPLGTILRHWQFPDIVGAESKNALVGLELPCFVAISIIAAKCGPFNASHVASANTR